MKKNSFLLFAISGVFGYFTDLLITLLLGGVIGFYFSRIPAFIGATLVTWAFNRSVTFKDRESKHDKLIFEYLHYASLMILGLVVNYITYGISIYLLPEAVWSVAIAVAVGSLSGMVVNYFNSKKYIFNK
jgi:putative flippase GtrA